MAARDTVVGLVALALLVGSFYFFNLGLRLMMAQPPRVAASLLAVLIGISLLASSVSLFRTWILARALERRETPGAS